MPGGVHYDDHVNATAPTERGKQMATKTSAATIARRAARKAVKQQFAAAGIRLDESQARYVWSTGLTVEEYQELRKAFGLPTHKISERKAAIRRTRAYRAAGTFGSASLITRTPAVSDKWAAVKAHVSEPKGDSAWVATDGTFYSVSFAGHWGFASKCAEAGIIGSASDRVGALERKGWVHISGYSVRNTAVKATLTPEQSSTLIAWAATSPKAEATVRAFLQ